MFVYHCLPHIDMTGIVEVVPSTGTSGPVNVTTSGGVLRETWVLTPVTGKRAKAGAAVPASSNAPIKIATHSIHQH